MERKEKEEKSKKEQMAKKKPTYTTRVCIVLYRAQESGPCMATKGHHS